MSPSMPHTCLRVVDPEASERFYALLGFERRGQLNFDSAYNVYLGLPGQGGRDDLPRIAFVQDPDGYRVELLDGGTFTTPQDGPHPSQGSV